MKRFYIFIGLFICLLYGCDENSSNGVIHTSGNNEQIPVKVMEVIDGDTIKVKYNGNIEKSSILANRHP